MKRLWFVVPCHGREDITTVCLRQLRRTCDAMLPMGIDATAVVIADDANLDTADDLGFATVRRDNRMLGRKFNDGYQLACSPALNPRPADYVVPCGSDDWIDPQIFRTLPENAIGVFEQIAIVNEERTRLARCRVTGMAAGVGIRIIPAWFLAASGFRPAEEDRKRAIDASTFIGIARSNEWQRPPTVRLDVHQLQLVDWKSAGTQLNTYNILRGFFRSESDDPFGELADVYPSEALDEMRALTCEAVAA